MELIYNNFDKLDISFQGALPEKILKQLAYAREQAQNEKREVLAELGTSKMKVMVAETGMRGGYRYRFDTGIDGEIWSIAHSTNSKNWNIRVSIKSLALALKGYAATKEEILEKLIALEAVGSYRYDSGKGSANSGSSSAIYLPLERVSRVDYCFDFIMDSAFEPLPKHFVAHQRTKKHVYGEDSYRTYQSLSGDKTETITVGATPRRQATIYNKTKEINAHSKQYWWDIWGIDKQPFKDGLKTIWRVEVRAGRDELDKWGLKRFKDLEDKIGDVIAHILKSYRYAQPLKGDLNRSRWPMHPIWDAALKTSFKALDDYSSGAIREKILKDFRENVIAGYVERINGNAVSLTAAQGRDISLMPIVIKEIENGLNAIAKNDSTKLVKKFENAQERFRFLT